MCKMPLISNGSHVLTQGHGLFLLHALQHFNKPSIGELLTFKTASSINIKYLISDPMISEIKKKIEI